MIAGLVPVNIPLLLAYSRYGNYVLVRRVAIEGLIIVSALKDAGVVKYLAVLTEKDPDSFIRYHIAKSVFYFVQLIMSQIETCSHSISRKETLVNSLKILMDSCEENREGVVGKYMTRLNDVLRELNPEKPKLKFKVPAMPKEEKIEVEVVAEIPKVKPVVETPKKPVIKRPPHLEKSYKYLKKLMAQPSAYWFMSPVDPVALNLPTYFDIIKEPMDFTTIMDKIEKEIYKDEQEFAYDVQLTFNNSILFNPSTAQVHIDAQVLLQKFQTEFLGIKIVKPELTQPEIIAKILLKLQSSDHSLIFRHAVDPNLYPSYYVQIKNPIDLNTIALKNHQNLTDFHLDVQLLLSNCFKFNKKGTFGYGAGTELQNLYNRLLKPYTKLLEERKPKPIKLVLSLKKETSVNETPALPVSEPVHKTPIKITLTQSKKPVVITEDTIMEPDEPIIKNELVQSPAKISSIQAEPVTPKKPVFKLKLSKPKVIQIKEEVVFINQFKAENAQNENIKTDSITIKSENGSINTDNITINPENINIKVENSSDTVKPAPRKLTLKLSRPK